VKYEEILDFFIAWLRKNPPPEFADWVWESRRSYLAHIACDARANLCHGEVINIRDVVTLQGQSVDELRQASVLITDV
jgi:hypothetical protein